MLLKRENVNPNHVDTFYGRTPLSWAADEGYKEVVVLLLAKEVANPNWIATNTSRTPLPWAAYRGHVGVVKTL